MRINKKDIEVGHWVAHVLPNGKTFGYVVNITRVNSNVEYKCKLFENFTSLSKEDIEFDKTSPDKIYAALSRFTRYAIDQNLFVFSKYEDLIAKYPEEFI